jgi:hypothetical protein
MAAVHGRTDSLTGSHTARSASESPDNASCKSAYGRTKHGDDRTYGRPSRRPGAESGIACGRAAYSSGGHARLAPALILLDIETLADRATYTHGDSSLERFSIIQRYL